MTMLWSFFYNPFVKLLSLNNTIRFRYKGTALFGMQGECLLKDISKSFDHCFDCEYMSLISALYKPGKITCFDISLEFLE